MTAKRIRTAVFLLLITAFVFVYNWFTPLFADDFSYSFSCENWERITSVFQIFPSMYHHFFDTNGRLVTHFLAQLFLLFGKNFFNVINSLAFCALGLIMYYHVYRSLRKLKIIPLCLIYSCLFIFTLDFGQSFLWLDGAANYLFGPLIAMLFLIPYRRTMDCVSKHSPMKTVFFSLGMFLFGLLAGNTNENMGVCVIILSAAFIIYQRIKFKQTQLWALTGCIGSLIGCCFSLFSPGTRNRASGVEVDGLYLVRRIFYNTLRFVQVNWGLIAIFVVLFILFLIFAKRKKHSIKLMFSDLRDTLIYFIFFLLSFYSLTVSPWFPGRIWSTFTITFVITIVCLFRQVISFCDTIVIKRFLYGAVVCLAVVAAALFSFNLFCKDGLISINQQWHERENTILDNKAKGNLDVYVNSISSDNRYSCFGPEGDLLDDYTSWQNATMAKYYEVDSIRVK